MTGERLVARPFKSVESRLGRLVITARHISLEPSEADLVVGRPGLQNLERTMLLGDAVLYDTPDDGILEVRLLRLKYITLISSTNAILMVSQVAPSLGVAGGLVNEDPNSSPFTADEVREIDRCLQSSKQALKERPDITPKQFDYLSRKLDEVLAASRRMGRKDWIMLVVGAMTSMAAGSALSSSAAKALFEIVGDALSWLFQNPLRLLF